MKKGGKGRFGLKGRGVDPQAREEVRALLQAGRRATGVEPRRRDLLIEHLHKVQDRYGQLSSAHLAALAEAMKLSQTEVYEVATFYHHFDVVKEGPDGRMRPPPALTVRVCDSLSCALFGSEVLIEKLSKTLGKDVRVLHAPCVGRCESAPVAVVGQYPVLNASVSAVEKAVSEKKTRCPATPYVDFNAYKKSGGYKLIADCLAGKRTREDVTKIMEDSALRGLAAPAFRPGANGRSSPPSPRRA